MSPPLVHAEGLVGYLEGAAGLRRILDEVDLTIESGEAFALLGASGSGKTFLAYSLLGLHCGVPGIVAGSARFLGVDLFTGLASFVEMRAGTYLEIRKDCTSWNRVLSRRVAAILGRSVTLMPQDPMTTLSPFYSVGRMIEMAVLRGDPSLARGETRERALELLREAQMYRVGEVADLFVHELSGGMAQRVSLALALAPSPELLIADEPTTGLDATLRARVIDLLREVYPARGVTLFVITHDTEAARLLARKVAVLSGGRVVEVGPADAVLKRGSEPKHPYTGYLLEAEGRLAGADAEGPFPAWREEDAEGCRYWAQCEQAGFLCANERPPLFEVGAGHRIACHRFAP